MHGAVLLDADHAPVRPVILWNDARATAECADMLAAAPDAGEIAGAPPMAGFTAPKLLWLSRHEPEATPGSRRSSCPRIISASACMAVS
jgi:xylulokinase